MPMIKRRPGRPRRSDPVPYAEFVKPFIPSTNDIELRIPPYFVHKFGGLLGETIQLSGPDAQTWDVDLKEVTTSDKPGVFMSSGWREFAENYELKAGETVIFKHSGNFQFNVIIFRADGCQDKIVSDKIQEYSD